MFYVNQSYSFEEFIKKSRFIGVLLPCATEQEVLAHIKHLQTQHTQANHIAYAYRIKTPTGIIYKFYDAGEPSGTAGKPIFNYIEGKNIINVLVVVIRYFGGVKLGAGGLTRAYGNTAKQVIALAALHAYIETVRLKFTLAYEQFQLFEYVLKKLDGEILAQAFNEKIQLTVAVPKVNAAELKSQFDTHSY